ncbi:MAG: hypothetical protein KAS64_10845 [Spirochaetes bacterium]|nr:hypothetical protein [Spirochaetota bacterium]
MNSNDFKTYLFSQMNEIFKYKWIESEKRGYDIGNNQAAFEWIGKYSEKFHNEYLKKHN